METTEDDLQRAAIEDQIANFGQTPIQMFRKKHPRRGPPIPIARPLYFAPDSISLTSIVSNTSHSSSAILYVGLMDSNVILVNEGLNLSVKMWLSTQLQSGGNFTFSGSQVRIWFSQTLKCVWVFYVVCFTFWLPAPLSGIRLSSCSSCVLLFG